MPCIKCGKELTYTKRNIIVFLIAFLVLLGALSVILKSPKTSPIDSPEKLFWTYYESIYEEDATLFKKCLPPYHYFLNRFDTVKFFNDPYTDTETHIAQSNDYLKRVFGQDWFNNIKILSIKPVGSHNDHFKIIYKINGDIDKVYSLYIITVNNLYYLYEIGIHENMNILKLLDYSKEASK
jgi:hypothetical protein